MRFTHHARNGTRPYGWSPAEVRELVIADGGWISRDDTGNIVVTGWIDGEHATAVLAIDDPGLIITVYGERRRRR